jgi:membrane-associated phospholipid phosphatase
MLKVSVIAAFLTLAPLSSQLMAQQADSTSAEQPADNAATADTAATLKLPKTSNFAAQFLHDQRDIWQSPMKFRARDLKWLAPVGVTAAALMMHGDSVVSDAARRNDGVRPAARFISNLGSTPMIAGASGTMWALGKVTHNNRLAETGRLATTAAIQTQLVISGLKTLSQRERPNGVNHQSFPSGHSATSFALASVVAHQYKDKPWVAVGAYGFATAVGLSRVGGLNHFPSDVVIGATIGELVSRFLIHRHERN